MRLLPSLRFRLVAITACALLVTSTLFAVAAIGLSYRAEDRVFTAQIEAIKNEHIQALKRGQSYDVLPSFIVMSNDPSHPQIAHLSLATLNPGFHEWVDEGAEQGMGREYVVAVYDHEDHGRYWYVFDTTEFESNEEEDFRNIVILLLVMGGIIFVGLVVTLIVGRWIFSPLKQLGDLAAARTPDSSQQLAEFFSNDEIGILARAFDQSQERVRAFVDREQAFTRDASHELRSPVTVIEGALDVIDASQQTLTPPGQRAVERMRRACGSMRLQIETFLTLSREFLPKEFDDIVLSEALQMAVAHNDPFLHDTMRINVQCDEPSAHVHAPLGAVVVVMDNMIRNAIQHGARLSINVSLHGPVLTVKNRLPSTQATHDENPLQALRVSGLGLNIVARLCDRFGWRCSAGPKEDGYFAQIEFEPTDA